MCAAGSTRSQEIEELERFIDSYVLEYQGEAVTDGDKTQVSQVSTLRRTQDKVAMAATEAVEVRQNASPMSTGLVWTEIKMDLASIEKLISVVLQQQADLGARLTSLDYPPLPGPSTDVSMTPAPGSSAWSTVAAGKSRRRPPPVAACRTGAVSDLVLHNAFAPLADLPTSPAPRRSGSGCPDEQGSESCPSPAIQPGHPSPRQHVARKATSKRNRSADSDGSSPERVSDKRLRPGHPSPRQHVARKVTSKRNRSADSDGSSPERVSDKRLRISSPTMAAADCMASTSPTADSLSSHRATAMPLLANDAGVVSLCSPCQTPPALSTADSVPQRPDGLQLPPRTSIHFNRDVQCPPEILIVGDSIVRDLIIPSAITYCIPGGRVIDISHLIPSLLNRHSSVNTVIAHVGTNDVMARNSVKLQNELETLCLTVESLGKRCIMSGPIPLSSSNSERFSRLHSLHTWLKQFCNLAGHDFIANFDIFWTKSFLYRSDGVHPNKLGLLELTTNFIQFIAFSTP